MSDRTQHVIDAIDGALADEDLPDAMRWSPEPAAVEDAGRPYTEDPFPTLTGIPFGLEHRRARPVVIGRPRQQGRGVWIAPAGTSSPILFDEAREWSGHLVDDVPLITRAALAVRAAEDHARAEQALRDLMTAAGEAVEQLIDRFRGMAEAMGQTLPQLVETLQKLATTETRHRPPPPQPDLRRTDPRGYALQLRQSRGTGPCRDLTRQRRPRRLP
ncbi:hypothetical protein QOZ88_05885 [Blastococcus sp. BMG 814]|uniref:Uncharacterized protein n=1 Tax=Blastococcus carthaginiensis TaxID=3050034 RepID=A0ABT9I9A5_9ACTN|nr:hypothetical protein [Blastococcus carthaginiensis]MDP5182160.1 hypothetical protein [Blastococcus carthaginiensis]